MKGSMGCADDAVEPVAEEFELGEAMVDYYSDTEGDAEEVAGCQSS